MGTRQPGGHREVIAHTASATLTNDDVGKIHTNTGAAGAVTLTMPTPSSTNAGGTITVLACADQNLTVATTDKMIIVNDLAADSVSLQTASQKIGGGFVFTSTGALWHCGVLGNGGTMTVTTAT